MANRYITKDEALELARECESEQEFLEALARLQVGESGLRANEINIVLALEEIGIIVAL